MSRTRSAPSSKRRRRLATTIVAGSITAAGIAAVGLPSPASATGLSTTISKWSSADFALGDPGTTLTVAAGIDDVGVIGRRLTTTRRRSPSSSTSRRARPTRPATSSSPGRWPPRHRSARACLGEPALRTRHRSTPRSTSAVPRPGARPAPAATATSEHRPAPTTSPINDSVQVNASWSNAPGSSPRRVERRLPAGRVLLPRRQGHRARSRRRRPASGTSATRPAAGCGRVPGSTPPVPDQPTSHSTKGPALSGPVPRARSRGAHMTITSDDILGSLQRGYDTSKAVVARWARAIT